MKSILQPLPLAELLPILEVTLQVHGAPTFHNEDKWRAIAFDCSVHRANRATPIWRGPFKMGLGHVKTPTQHASFSSLKEQAVYNVLRKNPHADFTHSVDVDIANAFFLKWAIQQKLQPTAADVLSSLVSDGSAYFDAEDFADWASNLGYSDDSIKTRAIWETCNDIGRAFARAFTPAEIEKLRASASEY